MIKYFWRGCWGGLKLLTLGVGRVKPSGAHSNDQFQQKPIRECLPFSRVSLMCTKPSAPDMVDNAVMISPKHSFCVVASQPANNLKNFNASQRPPRASSSASPSSHPKHGHIMSTGASYKSDPLVIGTPKNSTVAWRECSKTTVSNESFFVVDQTTRKSPLWANNLQNCLCSEWSAGGKVLKWVPDFYHRAPPWETHSRAPGSYRQKFRTDDVKTTQI